MNPDRDNPGVIAPPPLIFAAFLGAGLALDFFVVHAASGAPAPWRYGVAALLAVVGLAVALSALFGFRRVGTNPEPWKPTTAIVARGVYHFTRNPMYVGMALLHVAVAIAAESLWALILVVPALVVVRYGVIAREERYLDAKFGDDYRHYKAGVRRWL
jgi:protein-S-isoprenylcysteine O-methyltransferase Ste14